MRSTTVVAAMTGALALSALAVPAAHAAAGEPTISKVVVNGGKDVVVGTSAAKTFTVAVTASDDSGIKGLDSNLFYLEGTPGYLQPAGPVTCVASSATTSTCSAKFTLDPQADLFDNDAAGTWYVNVWVDANDGDYLTRDKAGSFKVKRFSKLTANASPEPVTRGRTITVTGALSRANWETSRYSGFAAQPTKLEFRKAGSDTYTTVKTVNSTSTGSLKTTVTAASDGYWRWNYAGSTTTAPIKATGDYVDVR